jgi:hypothetical protein
MVAQVVPHEALGCKGKRINRRRVNESRVEIKLKWSRR